MKFTRLIKKQWKNVACPIKIQSSQKVVLLKGVKNGLIFIFIFGTKI